MNRELQLQISGVMEKDGKKQAYVCFRGADCYAEGYIPDCVLTKSEGFSAKEQEQLIDYLRANLTALKKQAARINPLNAMIKGNDNA